MIIRLILGDQLNHQHTWFEKTDENVLYVMMEMRQETDYVTHHIQKVVAFFLAMRNFAQEKQQAGHQFLYLTLDDASNEQALDKNLLNIFEKYKATRFEYLLPDEYRLDEQLKSFCKNIAISSQGFDTEHFMSERNAVREMFKGKKMYLMENFYRMMRKKYQILMNGDQPLFDQWNFDADNRKKYDGKVSIPQVPEFTKDVSAIKQLIDKQQVKTIGKLNEKEFVWAVTRVEGLEVLDFFVKQCLPHFGTYEDAMTTESEHLFHSRLSFLLNVKLLNPAEVIEKAVSHWKANQDSITYAQIEGFVRQLLGWREYMRGIYWDKMPEFALKNFFENKRSLPVWYWTGETNMNCLKHAVNQSLNTAYAHHIQRLMITGNFASLAGINPDEVDAWYLGIYIDAIEWAEITNTRGMSQFADGGIVGTKPYVSSANYIDKMSNYCKSCHYDKSKKYGEKACPFNSLYWHFFERNREKLENNPRIGMAYQTLKKMSEDEKEKIFKQALFYLENLDEL
ncbi:MAG: cryptochrome/photolyase family protein [Verrucomicrobia bacterium]|nr:cryptochrome/photolyase family protein [Cytophagales bacterium]